MKGISSAVIGIAIVSMVGCFRSPPATFYSLQPLPAELTQEVRTKGPRVAIIVSAFPSYLAQPQMALRRTSGEVVRDDYHRWIEDLKGNFERTVMENLIARLDNADIIVSQQYQLPDAEVAIRIEVVQFEVSEQGYALLKARWSVSHASRNTQTPPILTVIREVVDPSSVEGQVAALSRTVAALSDLLSKGITQ